MRKRFIILCLSLLTIGVTKILAQGPYPPAAEIEGSTAVSMDDPGFIGWAIGWENLTYGTGVHDDWKTPMKAMGKASGEVDDVVSLGEGGQITLIFEDPIINGEGYDFAIFENSLDDNSLELAFVEVSNDGVNFERFDNHSLTPGKVGEFGAVYPTNITGYAGKYRKGYGTPFDLSETSLNYVTHIRIIDIRGDGKQLDSKGNPIYDLYPGRDNAGFDLEAIGFYHTTSYSLFNKQLLFTSQNEESLLCSYDLTTRNTSIIKNLNSYGGWWGNSLNDLAVEGKYAYISTNEAIYKVNIDTKKFEDFLRLELYSYETQTGKLQVRDGEIWVSKPSWGENSYLEVYNASDFSYKYGISGQAGNASGFVFMDDKIYVGINDFGDKYYLEGKLAIVDAKTNKHLKTINLGEAGKGICDLYADGSKIYIVAYRTMDYIDGDGDGDQNMGRLLVFDTENEEVTMLNDELNYGFTYGWEIPSNPGGMIKDGYFYTILSGQIAQIDLNTGNITNEAYIADFDLYDENLITGFVFDDIKNLFYTYFGMTYAWEPGFGKIYNFNQKPANPGHFEGFNGYAQFLELNERKDYKPFVANPIADTLVDKNQKEIIISLENVFDDIDNNNYDMVKYVEKNSNPNLLAAEIFGNELKITLTNNTGVAELDIIAYSNGKNAIDKFKVEVFEDLEPIVANPLDDINMKTGTTVKALPIADMFTDPDDDDNLIEKTISGNSNTGLVNAYIDGDILLLLFTPNTTGNAIIKIKGTSSGKSVEDEFIVIVTEDLLPIVASPIEDVEVKEDAEDVIVDISNVFSDPDNNDEDIATEIFSNSNETLVGATLNNNKITLSFTESSHGTADIVVRATSGGQTVDNVFTVKINADQPPKVAYPLPDVHVKLNDPARTVNIAYTFTDPDDDDHMITEEILSNSNPDLVTVTNSGNELRFEFAKNKFGEAEVVIRATSNGKTVDESMMVYVHDNEPPEVENPITDVIAKENDEIYWINLQDVFTDPDDDDQLIKKSVLSISDENMVNAFIEWNDLMIEFKKAQTGTCDIIIQAESNKKYTTDTFKVIINPDLPPIVSNPLKDTVIAVNGKRDISIYGVFDDPDDEMWEITYELVSVSEPDLLDVFMEWDYMTLKAKEQKGEVTIVVKATCNGKSVTDEFKVTITDDHPPYVANPIEDVEVKSSWGGLYVALWDVFADPDGDPIEKSVTYNENPDIISFELWGDEIYFMFEPGAAGSSIIRIQGTANGKSVEDEFTITITEDQPPFVANPVEDIRVKEGTESYLLDVSEVFEDPDDEQWMIWKNIETRTNEKLYTIRWGKEDQFDFYFNKGEIGTDTVTLRAYSGENFVEDVFIVEVFPDEPPYVKSPIEDITLKEDSEPVTIDVSKLFTDPDDDDTKIIESLLLNSNKDLLKVEFNKELLTIEIAKPQAGESEIIILGSSNGKTTKDTFMVYVKEDKPPYVISEIEDIYLKENAPQQIINLTDIFTDDDDDISLMTFEIDGMINAELISATIDNKMLTLDITPEKTGTGSITIRATSNKKSVTGTFAIHVELDQLPVVINKIEDVMMRENDAALSFSIENVFHDEDNPDEEIITSIFASGNETLANVALENNTVSISPFEGAYGQSEIIIEAESNKKMVKDTFLLVVNYDNPPYVANEIESVTVRENSAPVKFTIENVFDDSDDDNNLITKSIVANTNETLATVAIEENTVSISFTPDKFGESTVTILAKSHGKPVETQFNIVVNEDLVPVVANPVGDIHVRENAESVILDTDELFTDPDDEDTEIVNSILSNSNEGLVSFSMENNTMTANFTADEFGEAMVEIQGLSNGKTVVHEFMVIVTEDKLPYVVNAIDDISVRENSEPVVNNLKLLFSDPDDDDMLIEKTVLANSNETLVNVSLEVNTMTVAFVENKIGDAQVIIQGISRGEVIKDTFIVHVEEDRPPIVANPIEDLLIKKNSDAVFVDMSNVFDDTDDENSEIELSVLDNSLEPSLTAIFDNKTLELNVEKDYLGQGEIVINALSRGKTVTDTFIVTIAEDQPPVVANEVEDVYVKINSGINYIDFNEVFTDPDDPDENIFITLVSNSNSTLASVSFEGQSMTVDVAEDQKGEIEIVMKANSAGLTVLENFLLYIGEDNLPFVANPIPDIEIKDNIGEYIYDLSEVFSDLDDNNSEIIISVFENSNETLVNASINDFNLRLAVTETASGEATVTIEALSAGKTIRDEFVITIIEDKAPVVLNHINDVQVRENAENYTISLDNVFDDEDDDNALIEISIKGNSNESLVLAEIIEKELVLSFTEAMSGTADIEITALSNKKEVVETFTVSVVEDIAPVVQNPIEDITVNMDADDYVISLIDVFSDEDNDNSLIEISIESNTNEGLVTASISENELTLSFASGEHGSATIKIIATSNGKTVSDEFEVEIKKPDGINSNDLAKISVYPNPFVENIKIANLPVGCNISVINQQGSVIKTLESKSDVEKIELSNQAAGQYFIIIQNKGKHLTKKVIKK